jgi:two-component SAPR family response regulator
MVHTRNIYKQSTFSNLSFLSDYTIKTVEQIVSLNKEYETIKLFSKDSIEKYKQKYSFIHIGLVQVTIKPLTRQGLNKSVLLCLRDGRHLRFKDSLLGSIESSLYEGPCIF